MGSGLKVPGEPGPEGAASQSAARWRQATQAPPGDPTTRASGLGGGPPSSSLRGLSIQSRDASPVPRAGLGGAHLFEVQARSQPGTGSSPAKWAEGQYFSARLACEGLGGP